MAMIAVWLKIDEERLVQALQEAGEKLDSAEGEIVLDFSSVQRVDTAAVQALEKLARLADEKKIKVVVRGVNVGVYKVFKLAKLTGRFSFLN
jgi:anti-anti-sigma regulatory factor